jgi:hypothetical protein
MREYQRPQHIERIARVLHALQGLYDQVRL